jgi:hypothetical protein
MCFTVVFIVYEAPVNSYANISSGHAYTDTQTSMMIAIRLYLFIPALDELAEIFQYHSTFYSRATYTHAVRTPMHTNDTLGERTIVSGSATRPADRG